MRRILLFLFVMVTSEYSLGDQTFSCSFGKRAACLDYSDKVVSQRSVCFDEYACGFGGFVCKAKLDAVAKEYDDLADSYNELLRKNKLLAEYAQELSDANTKLVEDYSDLLERYQKLGR